MEAFTIHLINYASYFYIDINLDWGNVTDIVVAGAREGGKGH